MLKKRFQELDAYEKQFYDNQGNILPDWEYPYALWTDKIFYYPDGTPRPEFVSRRKANSRSSSSFAIFLTGKKEEVRQWRETDEIYKTRFGTSYTEEVRESHRRQLEKI